MTPAQQSEYQSRLLWLLAVVTDGSRDDTTKLAAIKAVQQMLPDGNPLRLESAESLLDRTLPAWGTRSFLVGGRAVRRRVLRPAQSLRDVWA
jgi:hypothetical protein